MHIYAAYANNYAFLIYKRPVWCHTAFFAKYMDFLHLTGINKIAHGMCDIHKCASS